MGDDSRTPLEMGAMIAAKYRVDGILGRGGMGIVYAATHTVSGKSVALKWMLPTEDGTDGPTERFIQEARATARIDHPNVVDIYDVGMQDGSAYLVMELLRGQSLADRLEQTRFAPADAVALLMPAMRGVAAAHARGVIHRDLKPDNIFLCEGPGGEAREPKVLDFGISKIKAGDGHDLKLTQAGMVMGTPHYMSPEQVRGTTEVDHRGDVYAFGVILYEMLTDTHPFDADTYNDLIVKIVTDAPVPIRELNPAVDAGLAAVVMRAMARDREDRYACVEELAFALEPYSSGARFTTAPGIPAALDEALRPRPDSDGSLQPQQASVTMPAMPRNTTRSWLLLGLGMLFVLAMTWSLIPVSGSTSSSAGRDAPAVPRSDSAHGADQPRTFSGEPPPAGRAPTAAPQGAVSAVLPSGAKDAASMIPTPTEVEVVRERPRKVRATRETRQPRSAKAERVNAASRDRAQGNAGAKQRKRELERLRAEGLPEDWDERLIVAPRVNASPKVTQPQPRTIGKAGGLSAQDL